jgi:hypothetical protein
LNDFIKSIINEIEKVKENYSNIDDIIKWAMKNQEDFWRNGHDSNLKYVLVKDILRRLSNIYFDITGSNSFTDGELNENIIKYFDEEFDDMLDFLIGTKSYYKVYLVRENYLENNEELFSELIKCAEKLGQGTIISNEEASRILENINLTSVTTREDMIYCEMGQTIINANEALRRSSNLIAVAGYGLDECKLNFRSEFELIRILSDVIKGEKKYRLSVCVNKDSILFTNIHVLED